MTHAKSRGLFACLALLAAPLACAPLDPDAGGGQARMIGTSGQVPLVVFPYPYSADPALATAPNPIDPARASAAADAYDVGNGKMKLRLVVNGMPANRPFGSHLHKLACDDEKAGGHYQNSAAPMGQAMDPYYANTQNEAWLDFQTDAAGGSVKELTMDWLPRAGQAKAIIIHHMPTVTGGGAGPKLACLPMNFVQ